ncbi:hypothetical protein N2152v2_002889 [Parachlorella kessleri]
MVASGNVGLAFGLVFAAGLSTTIGASVVFCTNLAQPKLLAVSLGFAAGVMLFVSFAEILMRKSVAGFSAVNLDPDESYRYAILTFFGGMLAIAVLDKVVHLVADCATRRSRNKELHTISTANLLGNTEPQGAEEATAAAQPDVARTSPDSATRDCAGERTPPRQQRMLAVSTAQRSGPQSGSASMRRSSSSSSTAIDPETAQGTAAEGSTCGLEEPSVMTDMDTHVGDALRVAAVEEQAAHSGTTSRQPPAVVEIMKSDHHNWALKKMGICVAMPIYYATGSKWKGFVWALLSGVSEPVGGLMGYLVLQGNQDLAFAIVFGLVAGMMVYISVKELIPTALRYDPDDKVVTTSVIVGMAVMAGSLLLFTL